MPQKNKSKSSSGTVQAAGPDSGEPPPETEPRASLASGDTAERIVKELEDLQIIKSPSDPKKYRYNITLLKWHLVNGVLWAVFKCHCQLDPASVNFLSGTSS